MMDTSAIRGRITSPLIWNALLIPLAILLVFNIVIRLTWISNARSGLKSTSLMLTTLIRESLIGEPVELNQLPAAVLQELDTVRSLVRKTSQVSGVDILVISRDGRVLFPNEATAGLPKTVLSRLTRRTAADTAESQIQTIRTLSGEYFFIKDLLFERLPGRSPWIVCVASYNPLRGILLTTNLILLAILAAGSSFSIWVARRTAARISMPLRQLAETAGQIGQGHFSTVEPSTFSSEIHDLQASLNNMANRLANADHMQKSFIQDASHELRTPLMVIQGYAEGLERGVLNDSAGTAAIIRNESQKLSQLVDSLLTLSRIENQAGQSSKVNLLLDDWLKDQVQRFQTLADRSGKKIDIVSDSAIQLNIDESLLEMVMSNLLSNAIRYSASQVTVAALSNENTVTITVADDGPGIAPQDLTRIFNRFFKGKNGQTGLGLAIARAAAEAIGGTLSASNGTTGGAVFTFEIMKRSIMA